jgi:hypothetical protein
MANAMPDTIGKKKQAGNSQTSIQFKNMPTTQSQLKNRQDSAKRVATASSIKANQTHGYESTIRRLNSPGANIASQKMAEQQAKLNAQ